MTEPSEVQALAELLHDLGACLGHEDPAGAEPDCVIDATRLHARGVRVTPSPTCADCGRTEAEIAAGVTPSPTEWPDGPGGVGDGEYGDYGALNPGWTKQREVAPSPAPVPEGGHEEGWPGPIEQCTHGVSEREECEHCGFGWVAAPAAPDRTEGLDVEALRCCAATDPDHHTNDCPTLPYMQPPLRCAYVVRDMDDWVDHPFVSPEGREYDHWAAIKEQSHE